MCIVLNHCVHCVHISMQGKKISRHGWIDDSASSIIELKKKAMSYAGAVFTPAYTNTKSTFLPVTQIFACQVVDVKSAIRNRGNTYTALLLVVCDRLTGELCNQC